MRREGVLIEQPNHQVVDIASWKGDDQFEIYPEGARDKSLLISPTGTDYSFLIENHRYLFKHSFQTKKRSIPDQYWTEIIAYRIGCMLGIPVPPAFVAYNSEQNICGSLIEWFLNYPDQANELSVSGGDIMSALIPSYDRKKGKEHNFLSIELFLTVINKNVEFETNWLESWCGMLLFDSIIGNTDRHQDNWELLWNQVRARRVRLSPVFDNGTSLGYEILESKMSDFYSKNKMAAYINKGRHHLKWHQNDDKSCQHIRLLTLLTNKHPDLIYCINNTLDLFSQEQLHSILNNCTQYSISVPLSSKRADFICHLVTQRVRAIKQKFERYQ
ncbi:HipA domain-containing protein [Methylomonas sp. AM2-LC]|uniref:HipA domain-containing protein n=1 Tax=Methylomonas sp. AM2-LC TaxID=3153301 RepID=UPI003266443A